MSQLVVGMDTAALGWLGGALTAAWCACFLGWTWWAYAPAHRARHDAASRLPLDGGDA